VVKMGTNIPSKDILSSNSLSNQPWFGLTEDPRTTDYKTRMSFGTLFQFICSF